jgi:hypothetical protein
MRRNEERVCFQRHGDADTRSVTDAGLLTSAHACAEPEPEPRAFSFSFADPYTDRCGTAFTTRSPGDRGKP